MGNAKSPTTIDLTLLLDGPQPTPALGTRYAVKCALKDGTIEPTARPKEGARGLHYRLTRKGRARAKKLAAA